jgi:gas vesicle protein
MNGYAKLLVAGTVAATIGMLTIANGQIANPKMTVDDRLDLLENKLSNLDNLVHRRTDTQGIEDRTNRDYNVDTRITNLERNLQQINNQLMDLQRQVQDANRIANQAQNDAQTAQQLARDAANRIQ